MKRHVSLGVEQLENRLTPATIFLRPPFASGAFLPPGVIRAVTDIFALPPVQVGRDQSPVFAPPGIVSAFVDGHAMPPPVTEGPDGFPVFLPPGGFAQRLDLT